MLIPMKVSSLTVDPFSNMPIVVLKDLEGRRTVPIWIGMVEASAIATELEDIHLARPMTHDLMKTLLASCSCKVDRVEIHDLKQNTFFATIYLQRADGSTFAADARPSDAIALALRTGSEILVAEKVIQRARRIDLRPQLPVEMLEDVSTSAFGKWKM
jgi:uncharacterized protein